MRRIKIKYREEFMTVFIAGLTFGAIVTFLFMALIRVFFW